MSLISRIKEKMHLSGHYRSLSHSDFLLSYFIVLLAISWPAQVLFKQPVIGALAYLPLMAMLMPFLIGRWGCRICRDPLHMHEIIFCIAIFLL
jgi:hypothetical protein